MAIDKIVEGVIRSVSNAVSTDKSDIHTLRHYLVDQADRSLQAVDQNSFDHPWLTTADKRTVAFSPTTATGQPLLINGKSTAFFPRGHVADAVLAFREAVNRGEFDDQLLSGGQPTVSPKIEGEQTPADLDNGSLSTGGGRTDADEIATRHTEDVDTRKS